MPWACGHVNRNTHGRSEKNARIDAILFKKKKCTNSHALNPKNTIMKIYAMGVLKYDFISLRKIVITWFI